MSMKLYLKTLAGLEALAADELKQAGAKAIDVGRRGVSFEGDNKVLYRICMHSRFAVRVLRFLTRLKPKHRTTSTAMAPGSLGKTCWTPRGPS